VHAAFADDALVGVLTLVEVGGGGLGSRRGIAGPPRDHHTRSGDALLEPAVAPMALRALLDSVAAHEPPLFALALRGVRDRSPTNAALAAGSAFGALLAHADERGSFVAVEGELAAFRARLSDNFRRNVRKAGNRIAKEKGTTYRWDAGPAADSSGLDAFLAVEASGWKGRAGTAIVQDAALARFYRTLIPRLARVGWLEWHRLEIDGRTAAIHFATRLGRSLVLLKIAYDESFARLGPGNLLFDRLVEREFEVRTVDEIGCLTDMAWHRNWELPRSSYVDYTLYPRRPLPLLAGYFPARAKAALKRVPWIRAWADRRSGAKPDGHDA
jgi:CelD/BcsL family acetyltransferase involved in cellulose biosynthesis